MILNEIRFFKFNNNSTKIAMKFLQYIVYLEPINLIIIIYYEKSSIFNSSSFNH